MGGKETGAPLWNRPFRLGTGYGHIKSPPPLFKQQDNRYGTTHTHLRLDVIGDLLGITAPTSAARTLLAHKHIAIMAAHMAGEGVSGLRTNEAWKRVKTHNAPVGRYVGNETPGTEKLKEQF